MRCLQPMGASLCHQPTLQLKYPLNYTCRMQLSARFKLRSTHFCFLECQIATSQSGRQPSANPACVTLGTLHIECSARYRETFVVDVHNTIDG
jgi:hypothetical protein